MTDATETGDRLPQPEDGDERSLALGWLGYYRDAVRTKCAGLSPEDLAARSVPPSVLSLLGLVRHLAEMENAYGAWPLSTDTPFAWVWGEYANGHEDDVDCGPQDAEVSFRVWSERCAATDAALAVVPELAALAPANGRSVRWNLTKLVGEYARHCGHADLLRERIDGATGE